MSFDDRHLRVQSELELPAEPAWITCPGDPAASISALVATTSFDLPTAQRRALLHITARGRYRLFVNDQPLGVGPVRGTRAVAFVDTFDVHKLLRPGRNTLRVEAAAPLAGSFRIPATEAAVWVRLDLDTPQKLDWSVTPRPQLQPDTGEYTIQLGPFEVRDFRVPNPPATSATIKRLPGITLLPRDIGPLPIAERTAHNVHAHHTTQSTSDLTDVTDIAARMDAEPFDGALGPADLPLRIEPDGRDHVLLLDFRTAFTEGLTLDVDAPAGVIMDVGYGEMLMPDGRLRLRTDRYHFADRWITAEGRRTYGPALFERGGRWVQLALRNLTAPLTLHAATAHDRRHPLPRPTPPAELSAGHAAVFVACVETLHACAVDTFIDCPRRESALWVNDMMVQVPAWLAAGGDPALVRRSLDLAFRHRTPCGLVSAVVPGPDKDKFAFPATNAYLPVMAEQYLDATGDADAAQRWLPHLRDVRHRLERWRDEGGMIRPPAEVWNFIDWSIDLIDGRPVAQAMSAVGWMDVLGLDAHARLEQRFGDADRAAALTDQAADAARRVHEACWDDIAGGYVEAASPAAGPYNTRLSKISAALAWLSGRVPLHDAQRCLDSLDDPDARTPELYLHHFLFEVWRRNHRTDRIDAAVSQYWQPMTDAGHSTIWETNVVQNALDAQATGCSLCHAFAVAPLVHWLASREDPTHQPQPVRHRPRPQRSTLGTKAAVHG